MCGIHFILSKKETDTGRIYKMVHSSHHRGPDNQEVKTGVFANGYFSLGHNRLSIIGNKENNQPFLSSEYAFSFNGEIFNFISLAKKYKLSNYENDASVVFELLKIHGIKIINEFNGMFAFVFIDIKNNISYMARDFFGQKPLFYSQKDSLLVASSESKAILATTLVDKEIDTSEVRNILFQKHVAPKSSIYSTIRQIAPGEILAFEEGKPVKRTQITPLSFNKDLQSSITTGINSHCLGTETPAVLFSGGLDSSIILSELVGLGKKTTAYTLDTTNLSPFATTDTLFAKSFAEQLNVNHQVITPTTTDFDSFIDSIDLPIGDGAFYFNWLLSKEISKDHKVALAGNGADELFGGYHRHLAYQKFIDNKSLLFVLSNFAFVLKYLPNSKNNRLLQRFLSSITKNEQETFINFIKLNLNIRNETVFSPTFSLKEALDYDITYFLPQDILSLSDQAGMAHGLEIRSPFLDHDIYGVSQSLDPKEKLKSNGKHHLKEIYRSLPHFEAIINRKKEGFGIPFIAFWGKEKMNELSLELTVLDDFITKEEASSIKKIIQQQNDQYSNEYWTLLTLTKWLKAHVNSLQ